MSAVLDTMATVAVRMEPEVQIEHQEPERKRSVPVGSPLPGRTVKEMTRLNFLETAGLGFIGIVVSIATTIFALLKVVFTLGLHQPSRASLIAESSEIVDFCFITAVGAAGVFFPKTVSNWLD